MGYTIGILYVGMLVWMQNSFTNFVNTLIVVWTYFLGWFLQHCWFLILFFFMWGGNFFISNGGGVESAGVWWNYSEWFRAGFSLLVCVVSLCFFSVEEISIPKPPYEMQWGTRSRSRWPSTWGCANRWEYYLIFKSFWFKPPNPHADQRKFFSNFHFQKMERYKYVDVIQPLKYFLLLTKWSLKKMKRIVAGIFEVKLVKLSKMMQ